MISLSEEASNSDMGTGDYITRVNRDACSVCNIEEVPAEMVIGEAVVILGPFIQGIGFLGRQELSSSGQEGEGESSAVVGEHGFDEACSVGVGVVCHDLSCGLPKIGDDGVDFRLGERVGKFEGCEMEVFEGHEPDIWEALVIGIWMVIPDGIWRIHGMWSQLLDLYDYNKSLDALGAKVNNSR